MSAIEVFSIVGNPVMHSKSPEMHNKAFKKIGLNAIYTRIGATSAKEALETAKEIGVKGLNVTAPFKEDFLELVDEIDETAAKIGAINTVLISEEKIIGFNTDSQGVLKALKENGVKLEGKQVVVIGAGGAAKAAVYALTEEQAKVTIVNREIDFEKAGKLAKKFNCNACLLERTVLEKVIPNAEVIVSCVSTAERIIPKELLNAKTVVFEANYSSETVLAKDAKEKECKFIDGKEWLLFQGIKVFEMFTGKKAPIEVMKKIVYANAGNEDNLKENIALIGFMGTGKTSVAKEITKIKGMEVINIDENIERRNGVSIKQIFEKFGEKKFREMETNELRKLNRVKNKVIDCGGGIILKEENRKILKENSIVVFLLTRAETILERTQGNGRPLLNVRKKKEKIGTLLSERMEKYVNSADIVVNSKGKKPEEIAKLIVYENNKTRD